MNSKHVSIILSLGIFYSIFLSSINSACQDKQGIEMVNTAAQKELAVFLEKIPNGMECQYGFNNREEFKNAVLLEPINFVFPTTDYYNNEFVDTINVNYYSSQYWKIPISVDNRICCFLQGKFIENNFKVFGIGGNLVANILSNLDKKLLCYSNMSKSMMLFPEIRRDYLIYYENKLNYTESKCISLNEYLESDSIKEQSLFETLNQCKIYSTQIKLLNNEY